MNTKQPWSVMKVRIPAAIFMIGLASCQRDAEAGNPNCDPGAATITDSSVGPLHLGEAVGALRVRCNAAIDTTVILPMSGWVDTLPATRILIGEVPVLALHDGDRVIALRVSSRGLRTTDSIEVGTSIARFRSRPGVSVSHTSHASAVLLHDLGRCGTFFELSGWGAPALFTENDAPIGGQALALWPDSIVVSAITVSSCRDSIGAPAVDSMLEPGDTSIIDHPLTPHVPDSIPPPVTVSPPLSASPPSPIISPPASPPVTPAAATAATPAELAELRRTLIIPVEGVARAQLIDTYFEARGTRTHEAIDIRAPRGTPVLSAMDGKLTRLFNSRTGGLMVYAADPADRFVLLYGHLERYSQGMRDGMPLKRGQVIGYVGTSGNAPIGTPHLHFGILRGRPSANWSRGTAVNPYPLLAP